MRIPNTIMRVDLKHLAGALAASLLVGTGPSALALPPVTNGLVLSLDASALTGLIDGQQVDTWTDTSGQNNHALRQGGSSAGYPKYVASGLNGMPALRFNSGNNNTGDYLKFTRITGIRSAFWVLKENATTSDGHFLLGDDSSYDFHRGEAANHTIWDGVNGWSSGNIRGGVTKLMGTAVNGTTTTLPSESLQLISLITSGNVQANQVTQDRTSHGSWQGDIAEILIYNRALTSDEEAAVGSYLTLKYLLLTAYTPLNLTVKLDSPSANQAFPTGSDVSAHASVSSGTGPYTVSFHKKTGSGAFVQVGSPQTGSGPTFTEDLGAMPNGSYQIYAEVTDSAGPPVTATSTTNSFTVADPVATSTALATSASPSSYGQSVTFTATVSPTPTGGTLQFYDNAVALGSPLAVSVVNGTASYTTTLLAAGSHTAITATYNGHGVFLASSSADFSQEVDKAVLTVTADNKVRAPGTPNPAFTYKIAGYQNGENATSASVTGTPLFATEASDTTPVGNYQITCEVGSLTSPNYSFAPVAGNLRILEGAVPVSGGLVCWYDASVGVTEDASGVSAWEDQSGGGHLATRGGHGAPSLVPNDVNGLSAVHLRGNNNILDCAGGMFTKEQYVVVRSPHITWNGGGSFLGRASTQFLTVRSSSYNLASGTNGFWQDHFPAAVSKNGSPLLLNQQPNSGPGFQLGTITDYMILKIVVDDSADAANRAAHPYYQIGQNETIGSCDMDIAEIIGYETSLSSEDEYAVTSYLGAKYAVTLPNTFRWQGPDNGVWSLVDNWKSSVPGIGCTAVFSDTSAAGATVQLDSDVSIAGLTFNNRVANQRIIPTAAETLTLSNGNSVARILTGGGTVTVGTNLVAPHNLVVSGPASTTLNLNGAVSTGSNGNWDEEVILGPDVVLNGSASWTTTGANYMAVGSATGATLTINDNAMVDWTNCWAVVVTWNGGDTGTIVQNGGVFKTPAVSTAWYNNSGPGIMLGGIGGTSNAEYDLNGGTLITPNVYNISDAGGVALVPPTGSAVFRFNGGVLQATQADNFGDPDVVAEGSTYLMGNLSHAYVGTNGAKINTAGFKCGMDQVLEHDPSAAAIDGGLTKMGEGILTILRSSTYTGTTKVEAGVLSCATLNSLAPTRLEVTALAKVDLSYNGSQTIPSLMLGGVAKGPGEYGAGSDPDFFTGTGTVTVASLSPYEQWANAHAGGQAANLDYNNDGVSNGIAYFMGANGRATNPPIINGKVTWPHVNAVTSFEVQVSNNLADWSPANPADVDTVSSPGQVIYTLPKGASKNFCRLLAVP